MKVRLFNPILISEIGGAQKYTATVAQYLVDTYRDLDLGFVVLDQKGNNDERGIDLLNERYSLTLPANLMIEKVDEGKATLLARPFYHKRLHDFSRGTDLFINCFHNVHYFYGKKNVHIVHFPAKRRSEGSPIFSRNSFLRTVGASLDRRYLRSYDLFICNSRFTEGWLETYWGIKPERREVLYPPVTGSQSTCNYRPDPRNTDLSQKGPFILAVSRFDVRKNVFELVKYFTENESRFANWSLTVAGACSENDHEYFDRVAAIARGHRVNLLSNIPKQELNQLYRKSGIFWHAMGIEVDENINPIDVEHFGITTVEAMAAGAVPVVVDKGGQREIVNDGLSGFRWRSFNELGRKTEILIKDQELRSRIATAAIAKSEEYSVESFYQGIDTIFLKHNLLPKGARR